MRTIQMTIDEPLLEQVDSVINDLNTTRSEFIREALRLALKRHRVALLEQQHAQGYARVPAQDAELSAWADAQDWGEA